MYDTYVCMYNKHPQVFATMVFCYFVGFSAEWHQRKWRTVVVVNLVTDGSCKGRAAARKASQQEHSRYLIARLRNAMGRCTYTKYECSKSRGHPKGKRVNPLVENITPAIGASRGENPPAEYDR